MIKELMRVNVELTEYTAKSTADAGYVWVVNSGSTDWADDEATIAANPSGQTPLGVNKWIVTSVADNQLINTWRGDQLYNHKITLIAKGYISTDAIDGTPAVGDIAYLSASGKIGTSSAVSTYGTPGVDVPVVGRFLSAKDSDGLATVQIDL